MKKRCTKCLKLKSLILFNKRACSKKDGLAQRCKVCVSALALDWYFKNKNRAKINNRRATKLWRDKNKVKRFAHGQVMINLRSGKLKKKLCRKCGNKKVEAHHTNYKKPLQVIWLCRTHHREIHQTINKLFS